MNGGIEAGPKPIAAVSLLAFSGAWMILAAIFGPLTPEWICVAAGVILGLAAVLMFTTSHLKLWWGGVALVVSALVAVLISGGLAPGLVGVAAGAVAIGWRAQP